MSWIEPAVMAGGGLLGGLFGGASTQMPPELQRIYQFLMQSARQSRQFGNSVPLSQPQEQMALAQQRGLAGQQMSSERNRIYGAMSPMDMGNPGAMGDLMSNLGSRETAGLMGIDQGHLLNALNARYAAKYQQAPQIASMAGGAASSGLGMGLQQGQFQAGQNAGLMASLGQLAKSFAYGRAQQQFPGGTPPIAPNQAGSGQFGGAPNLSGLYEGYPPPGGGAANFG